MDWARISRNPLGWAAGAAAIVIAALVVGLLVRGSAGKSVTDHSDSSVIAVGSGPVWPAADVKRYQALPQSGRQLGQAGAPVLIVVFVDLQCTVCRQFSMNAEQQMIDREVAAGKAKAELYPLTFIGSDSVTAASWSYGASQQNRLWQFASAFLSNAGEENSGYVTPEFLRGVSSTVPGLDAAREAEAAKSGQAANFLDQGRQLAKKLDVQGTPSVYVGTSLSSLAPVTMTTISDYHAIADAVSAVAAGHPVASSAGKQATQCSSSATTCAAP